MGTRLNTNLVQVRILCTPGLLTIVAVLTTITIFWCVYGVFNASCEEMKSMIVRYYCIGTLYSYDKVYD